MGFLNRMIYGNPNKPDLEVNVNPNPIKAFFEVLKIKIWDLVKINMLFAIFVVPTAIWAGINITVISRALESFANDGTMASAFFEGGIYWMVGIFFAGLIPCLLIMSLALPSLNYITRSYAREFHVWMMEDFLEKIKENWKQSLLYALALGVVIFVMYISTTFYTFESVNTPMFSILRGVMFVLAGLILVSTTFIYPLMVTFELKLKDLVRNSFLLTIAKLPQTLLILLVTAILPIFFIWLSVVWQYGTIALFAYYVLFGFSFNSFIINAYTNRIFEKIIVAAGENEAGLKPEVERDKK